MWTRTRLLNARGWVNNGFRETRRAGNVAADLAHYDVSLSQRDDKSSDIRHARQRILSEREMGKPDT